MLFWDWFWKLFCKWFKRKEKLVKGPTNLAYWAMAPQAKVAPHSLPISHRVVSIGKSLY